MGGAEVTREFGVTFGDSEVKTATVVTCAHTADNHGRQSVVVVGATVGVNWADSGLSEVLARTHGVAYRLADTYSDVLRGANESINEQMKDGRFLSNRWFELSEEVPQEQPMWSSLVSQVRRFRGVRGVATKNMVKVGANVLYGTFDEGQRVRNTGLDGFMDSATGEMVSWGGNLVEWDASGKDGGSVRSDVEGAESSDQNVDIAVVLNQILARLDAVEGRQRELLAKLDEVKGEVVSKRGTSFFRTK
ncbi:hypothetical protein [Plesiocystis pacifica]|uniref:hypothetical protein n=1 Tax=Plesiocystis pacifica TaxID=191768 RepID=UPI0012FB8CF9|nr:hypothetical protein [Plesiocystis pacifica]